MMLEIVLVETVVFFIVCRKPLPVQLEYQEENINHHKSSFVWSISGTAFLFPLGRNKLSSLEIFCLVDTVTDKIKTSDDPLQLFPGDTSLIVHDVISSLICSGNLYPPGNQ